jgi:hypothetical protein
LTLFCASAASAENWDRFRGPNGTGQSDAAAIPSEWQPANFLWKRPLPGVGHSSPVIWGDRLFVTSGDAPTGELVVQAFHALSGEPLWERRFPGATYSMHAFNSYASCTPAVDAERLYVVWRDGNKLSLLALTHDGDEEWRADAGPSDERHGFGASPVVAGDIVCVTNDNETFGELAAFDRATGDERWRISRPPGNTSFCTPCLLDPEAEQKVLIIASAGAGITAIDAATGAVAWQTAEHALPERVVASPIVVDGLVIVTCGSAGNGLLLLAVRPPTGNEDAREAYRLRQGVPQVPTSVAAGDLLFLWHDGGTVMCVDAATGQQHWRQRVGGKSHGSPIRVGDRIFNVSIDGDVAVIAAAAEFKLLARNLLGEPSRATPAVAHDRLYIRTESSLICIGGQ